MAYWLVVVSEERHRRELMYHHDVVEVPVPADTTLALGDKVALAAGDPLEVFGLAEVTGATSDDAGSGAPGAPEAASDVVPVRYTHRILDAPVTWSGEALGPGQLRSLDESSYVKLVEQAGPEHAVNAPRTRWLVGVDLPIEATSAPEAVRQFWTYVAQLGPSELPAFVSPADDELAMQAYVLGEEANLDPEEEDDE